MLAAFFAWYASNIHSTFYLHAKKYLYHHKSRKRGPSRQLRGACAQRFHGFWLRCSERVANWAPRAKDEGVDGLMGGWVIASRRSIALLLLFIELPLRARGFFNRCGLWKKEVCLSGQNASRTVWYTFFRLLIITDTLIIAGAKSIIYTGVRAQIRGYKYTALNHFPVKNVAEVFFVLYMWRRLMPERIKKV